METQRKFAFTTEPAGGIAPFCDKESAVQQCVAGASASAKGKRRPANP